MQNFWILLILVFRNLDPEHVLLSEGKIHWTTIENGEGEGYQVKTAFVWRAGSQASTAIKKLWITTELSWQSRVREPYVSSTCITPRAGYFSVATSCFEFKGSNLNPQSMQAANTEWSLQSGCSRHRKKTQIFHRVTGSRRAKAFVCRELITPKLHASGISFSQVSPQFYFAHLSEFHLG